MNFLSCFLCFNRIIAVIGLLFLYGSYSVAYAQVPQQSIQWQRQFESNIGSAIAGGGDGQAAVYFGTAGGYFYAVSSVTGEKLWQKNLLEHIVGAPVISADGNLVFVSTQAGKVYAYDRVNGNRRWVFDAGEKVYGSATYSAKTNMLFVVTHAGVLQAINADNGAQQWFHILNETVESSSALAMNGDLFIGTTSGYLFSIATMSVSPNRLNWRVYLGGRMSSPIISPSGDVYVASKESELYAVGAATGQVNWQKSLNGNVIGSPTWYKGALYVATNIEGGLYAIESKRGYTSWIKHFDKELASPPSIDNNGVLYVGSVDGALHQIELSSGASQVFDTTAYIANNGLKAIYTAPFVNDGRVVFASNGGFVFSVNTGLQTSFVEDFSWSTYLQSLARQGGVVDSDGDGLPDGWELLHGLNKDDPSDALLDTDGDGLTNIDEFFKETSPILIDSDGDSFSDLVDIFPLNPSESLDSDNDGIPDSSVHDFYSAIIDRFVIPFGSSFDIPHEMLFWNDEDPLSSAPALTSVEKTTSSQPNSVLINKVDSIEYQASSPSLDEFFYRVGTDLTDDRYRAKVLINNVAQSSPFMGSDFNEFIIAPGNGDRVIPGKGQDLIYDFSGGNEFFFQAGQGQKIIQSFSPGNTLALAAAQPNRDYPSFEYIDNYLSVDLLVNTSISVLSEGYEVANTFDGILYEQADDVSTHNKIAVNDYIIKPAPDCIGGAAFCSDELRHKFWIFPYEFTENDIGSDFANIDIDFSSVEFDNLLNDYEFGPCWVGDCFQLKIENYSNYLFFLYRNVNGGSFARARVHFVLDDQFNGTEKNERIEGRDDPVLVDHIRAGGGNDFIVSKGGDDFIYLNWLTGNDALDTLDFTKSQDTVVINDSFTLCHNVDCPNKTYSLSRYKDDLLVTLHDGWFTSSLNVIQAFAKETLLDPVDFMPVVGIKGIHDYSGFSEFGLISGDINSPLYMDATHLGTEANDGTHQQPISGGAGDDKIFTFGGVDIIHAQAGNDQVYAGAGNDVIYGGSGNDVLYGEKGSDVIYGGLGDDYLNGGSDRDVYVIGTNSGKFTIDNIDLSRAGLCVTAPCLPVADIVFFHSPLLPEHIKFSRVNDSLVIYELLSSSINQMTRVEILGYFDYLGELGASAVDVKLATVSGVDHWQGNAYWDGYCVDYNSSANTDDLSVLEDRDSNGNPDIIGGTANVARIMPTNGLPGCIKNKVLVDMSTDQDDQIIGFESGDFISSLAGNDVVDGRGGNDVIYGGLGDDQLSGGSGQNYLYGNDGDDVLIADGEIDNLSGGQGSDFYQIGDAMVVVIRDENATDSASTTDSINFLSDVQPIHLWFYIDDTDYDGLNDDLVIYNLKNDSVVEIVDWESPANAIEQVSILDSKMQQSLVLSDISSLLSVMPAKNNFPSSFFTPSVVSFYWN